MSIRDREIFKLKRNDRSPDIAIICDPRTLIDLTGAQVFFNMRDRVTGVVKIDRGVGYIVSGQTWPTIAYQWQLGDTDTAGDYDAEFEVVYSGGKPETFPNDDDYDLIVEISPDIG